MFWAVHLFAAVFSLPSTVAAHRRKESCLIKSKTTGNDVSSLEWVLVKHFSWEDRVHLSLPMPVASLGDSLASGNDRYLPPPRASAEQNFCPSFKAEHFLRKKIRSWKEWTPSKLKPWAEQQPEGLECSQSQMAKWSLWKIRLMSQGLRTVCNQPLREFSARARIGVVTGKDIRSFSRRSYPNP